MYVHHGCIGVYDASLCCTCIFVWFCNVYIVDVLRIPLYIYVFDVYEHSVHAYCVVVNVSSLQLSAVVLPLMLL